MVYGGTPVTVKTPFCIDSSSVNDNAGTDFATESNLSVKKGVMMRRLIVKELIVIMLLILLE